MIESGMKRADVTEEDVGDGIKWKLRTRMTDPRKLGEKTMMKSLSVNYYNFIDNLLIF